MKLHSINNHLNINNKISFNKSFEIVNLDSKNPSKDRIKFVRTLYDELVMKEFFIRFEKDGVICVHNWNNSLDLDEPLNVNYYNAISKLNYVPIYQEVLKMSDFTYAEVFEHIYQIINKVKSLKSFV